MSTSTIFLLIASIFAGAAGNVLIKIGSLHLPPFSLSLASLRGVVTSPLLMAGIILMIASFPLYTTVLQRLPLHVGYPVMTSLTLVSIILLSFFFLHEALTMTNIFGIVLLIAGLWLATKV